jgi:galactokinase
VVGFFSVLSAVNELANRPLYQEVITDQLSLAEYLGTTENGQSYRKFAGDKGVGTFGGSEDHTAILCSEPGKLKCFSYAPTTFVRAVSIPAGYVFVIGSSGVKAEKTGGAQQWYNDVATLAADAATTWRKSLGTDDANLAQAIRNPAFSKEKMVEVLLSHSDPTWGTRLAQRFEHFYREDQEYIPAALNALDAADLAAFGAAVRDSQAGAEQLLGNQVEETIALVRIALDCGAFAASAFGAGFGGSVWALVKTDQAESMRKQWETVYNERFPQHRELATFFISTNGPAAVQL